MTIKLDNPKIEQFFINECKSDIKAFSEFILKNLQQNKNKKDIFTKTAGILTSKNIDPIEWQNELRGEWDR